MPAAAPAAGSPRASASTSCSCRSRPAAWRGSTSAVSTGIGSFERHVVLKLITPERANDQTAVQMFLDEARLAASLNHQNVAQVFEVGEDAGIHYLAMEYVHGQDLRALLAKAGSQGTRVPLELALTIGRRRRLGAASRARTARARRHAARHRPSRRVAVEHHDRLRRRGQAARLRHREGDDSARSRPRAASSRASSRTWRRSSAAVATSTSAATCSRSASSSTKSRPQHRCFRADSDFDTMHRIVTGDVVRPTRLVQGYPPALEAIVMKALAIDAAQRYQSAGPCSRRSRASRSRRGCRCRRWRSGRFMRDMFGEHPEPWLGHRPDERGDAAEGKHDLVDRRAGQRRATCDSAGRCRASRRRSRVPTQKRTCSRSRRCSICRAASTTRIARIERSRLEREVVSDDAAGRCRARSCDAAIRMQPRHVSAGRCWRRHDSDAGADRHAAAAVVTDQARAVRCEGAVRIGRGDSEHEAWLCRRPGQHGANRRSRSSTRPKGSASSCRRCGRTSPAFYRARCRARWRRRVDRGQAQGGGPDASATFAQTLPRWLATRRTTRSAPTTERRRPGRAAATTTSRCT